MDEYIKRAVAVKAVLRERKPTNSVAQNRMLSIIQRDLLTMPAADVAPVVHGQWEQVKKWATKAKYRCSVCGREIMSAVKVNIEKYPYCHCGAKMDGGDNTER